MIHQHSTRTAKPSVFTIARNGILFVLLAFALSGCLHAIQEITCKSKFKKKYNCRMKEIYIVENEGVIGDHIRLRGCGKTVTYDGTKEVMVED